MRRPKSLAMTSLARSGVTSLAVIVLLALSLSGCGGGGSGSGGRESAVQSISTPPPAAPTKVTGSVGDGPVVGAQITATDEQNSVVAQATSDDLAKYQLSIPASAKYPLTIKATGGTDMVTGRAPEFDLTSVVMDATQVVSNLSPIGSMIHRTAQCRSGGLTAANLDAAEKAVAGDMSAGLDATLVPHPITTPVSDTNVAHVVKANQVMAEILSRTTDAMQKKGRSVTGAEVLDALACDLADGELDGAAVTGGVSEISETALPVMVSVLLEAITNQLQVDGKNAHDLLDTIIHRISPDSPATVNTDAVLITPQVIIEAHSALASSMPLQPDPATVALAVALEKFDQPKSAAALSASLPQDTLAVGARILVAAQTPLNVLTTQVATRPAGASRLLKPTLAVTADTAEVQPGSSTLVHWSTTNALSCAAIQGFSGQLPINGSRETAPLNTSTTYTLTCLNRVGSATGAVTVSLPLPTVTISADQTTVNRNDSTTLRWSTNRINSCVASGAWTGNRAASGAEVVGPITGDSQFTLTCTDGTNSVTATATVLIGAPALVLNSLQSQVALGAPVVLSWSSVNADSCVASGGWSGTRAASGTATLPSILAPTTFNLDCTGPGGAIAKSVTVGIGAPSLTLSFVSAAIDLGATATLNWHATNTTACTASGAWTGAKPVDGPASIANVRAAGSYVLTCTGPGGSASQTAAVSINAPTLTLTASAAAIDLGTSVTFNWHATSAATCTASGAWTGAKATDGPLAITNANGSYTLTCDGPSGSIARTVAVSVNAPTLTFTSSTGTISLGGSATLTWHATNATACAASGAWTGAKVSDGSLAITNANGSYTLTCDGPGGTIARTVAVGVTAPTLTLTASSAAVDLGSPVTLTWHATNATACVASGAWTGAKGVDGPSTVNVNANSLYVLTCDGPGGSIAQTVAVTVKAPTLTLTTSAATIDSGSSITLNWHATSASACVASGAWTGTKAADGPQTITNVSANGAYVLTCTGPAGSIAQTVAVAIKSPTLTFTTSAATVDLGNPVTLSWHAVNATACTATGAWTGAKAVDGPQTISSVIANGAYVLTCTGPGGSIAGTVTEAIKAPTLTFTTSAATVNLGSPVIFSWHAVNATACTATGAWTGAKAADGPQTITNVSANGSYVLTCTGPGGSIAGTVAETINPPTLTFTATPATVDVGGTVTLAWHATNATTCTAGGAWSGTKGVDGPQTITVTANGAYALSCDGPSGTISQTVSVNNTVPTLTLTASATSIDLGATVTLSWHAANATACTASGAWTGAKGIDGPLAIANVTANSTYILTCNGPGGSIAQSAAVNIKGPTAALSANLTTINAGQGATLTWSSTNATGCTSTGGWTGARAASGSVLISPITTALTFSLICAGPGGSSPASAVTVNVLPVVTLTASANSVPVNGTVNLTWTSLGGGTCVASGDTNFQGTLAANGTVASSPITANRTYALTCTNAVGAATANATVTLATATLSVTTNAGGSVTSAPSGISCTSASSAGCSVNLSTGTPVSLTATPQSGYAFAGWSGACGGTASCALTLNASTSVTASFTPLVPPAGAPVVLYTDALSGPTAGGEGNLGAYLSIFGKNFGSTGLGTTTKVFIGNAEVANYRYVGVSKVFNKLGVQQIAVQVGALGSAAQGVALPVKVVVGGVNSNTNVTFTPNPGRILFVSLTGNDATAVAGDITKPWRFLQTPARAGAYGVLRAGDHIVIRGGNWSDLGFDNSWLRFRDPTAQGTAPTGASATGWIHITAYPGPINGNVIEDVHYTTPASAKGGIQGPNSAYFGTTGEYVSLSNMRIDVNASATADAAPFNEQYGKGPWRVVNNEAGPWPSNINSKGGGYAGHGQGTKVFGNHIHDMACVGALENHGIYVDSGGTNIEIAFNWIHDITGGNLIQFYDNVGLAGSNFANFPANWPGFTGMQVHHNWLERSGKYGLNMADGIVSGQIWNNVIIGANLAGMRFNTISHSMDMTIAFNTLYDNGRAVTGANPQISNTWGNYGPTGTIRIYNNVIAAGPNSATTGAPGFYSNSGTSDAYLDFKRNLYFDRGLGWSQNSKDASGLYVDPRLIAPTTGDLTLGAGSPAIDAGTQAIPFTIIDDLTNVKARPQGGALDIGAYER